MTVNGSLLFRHKGACRTPDVESYGRTDASGTRALIVWCRECRASRAAPWPFYAPPPRPRPAVVREGVADAMRGKYGPPRRLTPRAVRRFSPRDLKRTEVRG